MEKENTMIFEVFKNVIESNQLDTFVNLVKNPSTDINDIVADICNSALLSENVENAKHFLLAFCSMSEKKLKRENSVYLANTLERLNDILKHSWLPIDKEESKQNAPNDFPVDIFPDFIENYIDGLSNAIQTDRAIAAVTILSVFALSMQGKYMAMYPDDPTHKEHLPLYTLIVGEPGTGKSPIMKQLAIDPLNYWIDTKMPEYQKEFSAYDTQIKMLENQLKNLERKLTGDEPDQRILNKIVNIKMHIITMPKPSSPHLLIGDTTTEALVKRLTETGGTVGMISDEGCFTETLAGRYSSGETANIDVVLQMINGAYVSVDRKGSEPVELKRPLGTICLGLQPVIFDKFIENEFLQGRGLTRRFLFFKVKETKDQKARTPKQVKPCKEYEELIYKFLDVPLAENPPVIPWSISACEMSLEYIQTLIDRQYYGDLQSEKGYVSKIKSTFPRIATILHMIWTGNEKEPISKETAYRAIKVCKFFVDEKVKSLDNEIDREQELLNRLLEKIKDETIRQNKAYTPIRVLQQKLKRTKEFKCVDTLKDYLHILESENMIELAKQGKKEIVYISPYLK
ncbi:MAG: DUF3987 domain-containing protein [Ruminococcus sp.]|nr:DUF3987 domain-containing protein [Ruminococcus sp.]